MWSHLHVEWREAWIPLDCMESSTFQISRGHSSVSCRCAQQRTSRPISPAATLLYGCCCCVAACAVLAELQRTPHA